MAGRPEDVSDAEILQAVSDMAAPVASTSEIRDQLPIKHKGTYDRLMQLKDDGLIEGRKLPNGWVWSLTDRGAVELQNATD